MLIFGSGGDFITISARKYNFETIIRTIPLLAQEKNETLEIMLQDDLYREIKERRTEFQKESGGNNSFSVEEVLKEIEGIF